MTDQALVDEWLKRARSNLERARAGKASEEILLEDLCFDCQQTVEKAIKALLVHLDVEYERIHSIAKLLKQVEGAGVIVPDEIKETSELTVYAVDTRYPGDYDPVTEEEYKLALAMAEKVIKWVEKEIEVPKEKRTDDATGE